MTVIQLAVFLAPLVLARAGFMAGEAAGLAAIMCWFVLGMPLSYAAVDRVRRLKALAISREGKRLPSPLHDGVPRHQGDGVAGAHLSI